MKNRRARIYFNDTVAGVLEENENGYSFTYDKTYLENSEAISISLSIPLRDRPHQSNELFQFFRNLIAEGWLLDLNSKILKIDPADEFGMLVATCKDCVGAVSVVADGDIL